MFTDSPTFTKHRKQSLMIFNLSLTFLLREGLKKNLANYLHPHVDKKFLIGNIINFENVDKPSRGGVGQCG